MNKTKQFVKIAHFCDPAEEQLIDPIELEEKQNHVMIFDDVMLDVMHIWSHSHQSLPFNLHTGSFIPLKLPFFVSKMTFFLQSINKKFKPWYFLICRPPLIRLIIKFSCPGYPLFMVSQAQH